jgi:hypothetical protein
MVAIRVSSSRTRPGARPARNCIQPGPPGSRGSCRHGDSEDSAALSPSLPFPLSPRPPYRQHRAQAPTLARIRVSLDCSPGPMWGHCGDAISPLNTRFPPPPQQRVTSAVSLTNLTLLHTAGMGTLNFTDIPRYRLGSEPGRGVHKTITSLSGTACRATICRSWRSRSCQKQRPPLHCILPRATVTPNHYLAGARGRVEGERGSAMENETGGGWR